jgi:7-carboxy-7-deazaguanine synthase
MTGCNLRCTYCDTTYAYEEGTELSVEEILGQAEKGGIPLIEITGGEPLLQGGVHDLMGRLLQKEFAVLIETNGSQNIGEIDPRVRIILDLKTPGSGMSDRMDFSNLSRIRRNDEVKFVLTGRTDYEWSREIIHSNQLSGRCHILLSPAHGILPPEKLAQWIIADRLPVRLNLPLHKYIYGIERRGV